MNILDNDLHHIDIYQRLTHIVDRNLPEVAGVKVWGTVWDFMSDCLRSEIAQLYPHIIFNLISTRISKIIRRK